MTSLVFDLRLEKIRRFDTKKDEVSESTPAYFDAIFFFNTERKFGVEPEGS